MKGLLGFTKTEKPERGDESLGDASQQPQDGVDRDVSQGKGADRAHSPVGSLASNVIPPVRTVGIVPLTAEGYIDIDDTYLIPPHMEGRPRLMRASAKLELASDQKGKDFGVPSVREFSTLLYGLVLSERDSVQRFQKVEASMQKISKVGDEKMKASLLALLYRRANNYYFDGLWLTGYTFESMNKFNGTESQQTPFGKLPCRAIRYSALFFFSGSVTRGFCWRFLWLKIVVVVWASI